jgi:hypothetical protein
VKCGLSNNASDILFITARDYSIAHKKNSNANNIYKELLLRQVAFNLGYAPHLGTRIRVVSENILRGL